MRRTVTGQGPWTLMTVKISVANLLLTKKIKRVPKKRKKTHPRSAYNNKYLCCRATAFIILHACITESFFFTRTSHDTTHVMIYMQARVLLMLQEKLPECTNKQRCDEFCTSFCYLNSKGARKKLVQALIKLPRSRLDLTSTYSRCVQWLSLSIDSSSLFSHLISSYLLNNICTSL